MQSVERQGKQVDTLVGLLEEKVDRLIEVAAGSDRMPVSVFRTLMIWLCAFMLVVEFGREFGKDALLPLIEKFAGVDSSAPTGK